jgi:hypothetical protein
MGLIGKNLNIYDFKLKTNGTNNKTNHTAPKQSNGFDRHIFISYKKPFLSELLEFSTTKF